MTEYKPNSNRFKEEQKQEKRVDKPIVTGTVSTKKKSGFSKFAGEFISEDAKNVKSYIITDVLIPAAKKALVDIVTDGVNMIFYGGTRGPSGRSTPGRISYTKYYDDGRQSNYRTTATGYSYDDIELETRGEAQDVLDRLDELMDTYQVVRVADLYDLVGVTGSYTDNKYGWTNIRNAEIVRTRNGKYMIKMPRAIPID